MEKTIDPQILAFHGWAFSADDWSDWVKLADADSVTFNAFERGYFGSPSVPVFRSRHSPKILVTHSWGLFMVPTSLFEQADLLVIINGFVSLTNEKILGELTAGRLRRQLRAMLLKLKKDPESLLDDFYRTCFNDPSLSCKRTIKDLKQLENDLQAMNNRSWSGTEASANLETILMHSGEDTILHSSRTASLKDYFEVRSDHLFPHSSHALPFEEADRCFSLIKEWIHIFEDL